MTNLCRRIYGTYKVDSALSTQFFFDTHELDIKLLTKYLRDSSLLPLEPIHLLVLTFYMYGVKKLAQYVIPFWLLCHLNTSFGNQRKLPNK